jgi:hippurate hydrolase
MCPPSPCDHLLSISTYLEEYLPSLVSLYMDLHAHPELSGQEVRTSWLVAREMESAGFRVARGIGGHGVVGVLENGDGPVVMIRADMDALPLEEATGLPYASRERSTTPDGKEVGVMHACGHDLHCTVLLGTAHLLSRTRGEWSGTVVLVAQPSEETVSGAERMIQDGLYTRFPRPDCALSLHVSPDLPPGHIGYREGVFTAGAESLDIIVRGIGGHAAHPDQCRDPIVLSAQLILQFQTIITREVPAGDFGLITVASIHGGTKHNAIPDEVHLQANIRFFNPEVRDMILSSIERVCEHAARSAGIPEDRLPVITLMKESVPPLRNDPELTAKVIAALIPCFGTDRVHRIAALTGSEDFGLFGDVRPPIPLCYLRLGTGARDGAYLHSPRFCLDPNESTRNGVTAMSLAALASLNSGSNQRGQPSPPGGM